MTEAGPGRPASDPTREPPRAHKLRVYRVFTVFLGPQTVHNLFKLCYPAIS